MTDYPFHAALADALLAYQGAPLFGVIGDGNLFFVNSFVERGGTYVSAANEGPATQMAQGYASVSGEVGFATLTHGALTNAVTGLSDAARGNVPLVLVAGDTARWDTDHVQRLPHAALAAASGAGFVPIESADDGAGRLHDAVALARAESRPVVLNVPADLTFAPARPVDRPREPLVATEPPDPSTVESVVQALLASTQPVILAGRGACGPRDRELLLTIARRTGARVATTLRARDLFRDDELNLGIFGGLATPAGRAYLRGCDLVVAFGAGLNSYTTEMGRLLAGRTVIRIDSRPAPDSAEYQHVQADARRFATAMVVLLEAQGATGRSAPHASPAPAETTETPGPADAPLLGAALDAIDELLPDDRLLVVDGGRYWFHAVRRLHVCEPRHYVHALNIGSIGLGLGLAIGAAYARPGRLSVLVSGDGALMLSGLSEFNTAVRHRVPLVVFVMNDRCYGAEWHQLTSRGVSPELSRFDWPDFAAVARSLGGHGETVTEVGDLRRVRELIAAGRLPLLVDVQLDPTTIPMSFRREQVSAA